MKIGEKITHLRPKQNYSFPRTHAKRQTAEFEMDVMLNLSIFLVYLTPDDNGNLEGVATFDFSILRRDTKISRLSPTPPVKVTIRPPRSTLAVLLSHGNEVFTRFSRILVFARPATAHWGTGERDFIASSAVF